MNLESLNLKKWVSAVDFGNAKVPPFISPALGNHADFARNVHANLIHFEGTLCQLDAAAKLRVGNLTS
jgi:hypothetical protein